MLLACHFQIIKWVKINNIFTKWPIYRSNKLYHGAFFHRIKSNTKCFTEVKSDIDFANSQMVSLYINKKYLVISQTNSITVLMKLITLNFTPFIPLYMWYSRWRHINVDTTSLHKTRARICFTSSVLDLLNNTHFSVDQHKWQDNKHGGHGCSLKCFRCYFPLNQQKNTQYTKT